METAEKVDWAALNAHAAGRPARRLVTKAITAAGGDRQPGVVLDLGAGAGADSLQFARHGWTVHAYDSDDTLAARLVESEAVQGVTVDGQSLVVSAPRAGELAELLPRVARDAGARLLEVRPLDDSLESVFRELLR